MQRDYSIDILKCLAALIITWSHFEKPLGDYSFLATGGDFRAAIWVVIEIVILTAIWTPFVMMNDKMTAAEAE